MQFKDRARHGMLAVFSSAIAISCVVILLVASGDERKASLEQGGSVSTTSTTDGTTSGEANIFFGALHVNKNNVAETWLRDDQVSPMNVGVNGPVTRNEGMYNNYAAVKTYWADTMNMDNLRGGTFVNGGPGWDVKTYALLDPAADGFPSDLSALHPVGHARVLSIDFHGDFSNAIPGTPDHGFALVASGALALAAGEHTFCTTSDDGSWLFLDGALLFTNRGSRAAAPGQVCRTTTLAAGAHTVLVDYLGRTGGFLEVTLDGAFLTPDGRAAPGVQEGYSSADGVGGFGNTAHTYSGDTFY